MTDRARDRGGVTAFGIGAFLGLAVALAVTATTASRTLYSVHVDWPTWVRVALLGVWFLITASVLFLIGGLAAVGVLRLYRDRHRDWLRAPYRTFWVVIVGMVLVCVFGQLPKPLGTPGEILVRALVGAGLGLLLGLCQLSYAGDPETPANAGE